MYNCSAGVGRTGTFIGLWNLDVSAELKAGNTDVRSTVLAMRRYRKNLVQSKVGNSKLVEREYRF